MQLKMTGNGQIQDPLSISTESEIDLNTYSGIISERYANGSPSLWKTMINGKAEGLWLEWYPSGILRYRAYWKNGKGHGKWEYFYPNGQLRSESFYIDDITQGILKNYYENGQIKTDAVYIDDKKEGIEKTYDSSGKTLTRKRYENGIERINEPQIFYKGLISDLNNNEWGISFMPDGNSAYFTRRDFETGQKRIYETNKTKNGWSQPSIAPFSTHEDEAAFINSDGSKLYFASYRPLPDGTTTLDMDMNIWVVRRENDIWSEPKPLSSTINRSMKKGNVWPANYEAGPMTDKDGNLYFWTKSSTNNATNLYYSIKIDKGEFSKPSEIIPPSSNKIYDTSPHLSTDGSILFFCSDDRQDGYGGSDIYYSVKSNNGWSRPKNLGPVVNSYQSEGSPSFSPDGKYFYFSSNRGDKKDKNGESIWNLYHMETKFLMIEK